MSKAAYICDMQELGLAYINKNQDNLAEKIKRGDVPITYNVSDTDDVIGCHIHLNKPLTRVYGFTVYMVDFVFSSIETLHDEKQHDSIIKLMQLIDKHMSEQPGYYNFRIPSHVVDVIKAFNATFERKIFCGGLVTYISMPDMQIKQSDASKVNVFLADEEYISKHEKELYDLAGAVFDVYQGQYHISNVTASKATQVYTDWISKGFMTKNENEEIIVAEYRNEIVGFWTFQSLSHCLSVGIGGVGVNGRGLGVYKSMLNCVIEIANKRNKFVSTGTQFDNFIVQNVWNKLGLTSIMSYYSMHIDRR